MPIGLSPPCAVPLPACPTHLPTPPSLPSAGCANRAPGLSLFCCAVSGSHGKGNSLHRWPGASRRTPDTSGGGTLPNGGFWATMGQVCFTAISSNRACHHGLHCSQFSAPDHVLCVRLSECSMAGVRGKGPFSLLHCTMAAVACRAVGVQTFGQAHAHVPGRSACWAVPLLRARGAHAGQGEWAGRHSLLLAPLGCAFPLLVFGRWAYRPSGCTRHS